MSMDLLVVVRRQWNDHRTATVPLLRIRSPHWSTVSGGVGATAPRPFIHGYIDPESIIEGEVAWSGCHHRPGREIKVCIVRKDNDNAVIERLKAMI